MNKTAEQVRIYRELKAQIMEWNNMTESEFHELIFECGCAYAQKVARDEAEAKEIRQDPIFWEWFKYRWFSGDFNRFLNKKLTKKQDYKKLKRNEYEIE